MSLLIQQWIGMKLKDIAAKLPTLVYAEPQSFSCGFIVGYKKALLDLEAIIEDGAQLKKSKCWCGDKYHDYGAVCL